MKRQLRRWLKVLVVSAVFTPGIIFSQDASGQARDLFYNKIQSKIGTPESLQQNFLTPLMSDVPLKTLDNSKEGKARIVCPSSNKIFLKLEAFLLDKQDISVRIYFDANLDGSYDQLLGVPLISGVCTNGFISCKAGEWSNCKYYEWTFSGGRVGYRDVKIEQLGGCYCINKSCNNDPNKPLFLRNKEAILRTLGGGVVGAIGENSLKYAVSDVRIEGNSIIYSGQDFKDCDPNRREGDYSKYFKSPSLISNDLSVELARQANDPRSPYYSIKQLWEREDVYRGEIKQCKKERIITLDKQIETQICDINRVVTAKEKKKKILGGLLGTKKNCEITGEWTTESPGCKVVKERSDYCFLETEMIDSVITVNNFVATGNKPTGSCRWVTCTDVCRDWWGIHRSYKCIVKCEPVESIIDTCAELEKNSKCKLKTEVVDGVVTFRDFNPVSYRTPEICKEFSCMEGFPNAPKHNICRPWWKIEREYLCESGREWDLSEAKKRVKKVTGSASEGVPGIVFYDDTLKDNLRIEVGNLGTWGECEKYCIVKKKQEMHQVTDKGTTFNQRRENYVERIYKTCEKRVEGNREEYRCPIENGETLVRDCGCHNEFGEAVTLMQVLRQAGKDMICKKR